MDDGTLGELVDDGNHLGQTLGGDGLVLEGAEGPRKSVTIPILGLVPGRKYRISAALRREGKLSGAAAVVNFDKNWRMARWGGLGKSLPADGAWHRESSDFTAGRDLFRPRLLVYADGPGRYSLDELIIEEIKEEKP